MGDAPCTPALRKTHSWRLGSQESMAGLCTEPDPPPDCGPSHGPSEEAAVPHLSEAEARVHRCPRRLSREGTPSDLPGEERLSLGSSAAGWTVRLDQTHDTGRCLLSPAGLPQTGSPQEGGSQAWGQGQGQERLGLGSGEATAPIPLTLVQAWEGCVRWWHRGRRPGRGEAVSLGQWL